VPTTDQGGERGDDSGKPIHGRKCPVSVDVLGRLGAVVVSRAAINDAVAAPRVLSLLEPTTSPRVQGIWADHTSHSHALTA
jgi:hypothetical protein